MTQLKNLDFLYDQFFFKESYADSYFQQCALNRHVDNEDKGTVVIHDTAYETRAVVINESGLYSLILSSKLPQAKAFKRWVTSEVLPQIRLTGGYIPTKDAEGELLSPEVLA